MERAGHTSPAIRVARIVEALPPAPGGKELHAAELMAALSDAGVVQQVFFRSGDAPRAVPAVRVRTPRRLAAGRGTTWFSASVARAVARAHARSPFDLIHAHGDFPEALAAAALATRFGIPAVLSVHGGLSQVDWHEAARVASFSAMETVFAVSSAVAEDIARIGVSSRVVVRPSAVRDEFFAARGTPKRPGLIVSVGRLAPVKGYEVLLDAFDLVSANGSVELCLIADGTGDYADRLRAAAARRPGVRCWAERDPHRLAELVASARAFVLPSVDLPGQREGTPTAVLEALAAGTQVIATDAAGVVDLVRAGERVSVVPHGDARALANALQSELDGPEPATASPVTVQTWRQAAEEVAAHYETAVAAHRQASAMFAVPLLEVGGAERLVLSLANGAATTGHRTVVAGAVGSLVRQLDGTAEHVPLRFGNSIGNVVRNALAFSGAMARTRPRAVNCHHFGVGLSARLGGSLARVRARHVLTVHLTERPRREPIIGLLAPLLFDRVLPVAETVRRDLVRFAMPGLAGKVRAVHGGIEAHPESQERRSSVGSVARLVERKGHRLLLDAWARVIADPRAEGWQLELWGEGPEQVALEEIAKRLGITGSVRFRGVVPDAVRQLGSLEIVALASTREALPLALVEAMAAGCAIAASDLPGCRELLGDSEAGILFPPGDPQAIADALLRLISSPVERGAMAARGRARFEQEFTLEHMLERYGDELGIVLATRR